MMSPEQQLLDAVTFHRTDEVKTLLERGANPNYELPQDPLHPDTILQPRSPLTMVVFRISDNDLSDEGLLAFKHIAQLLIQHGAHTKAAMQLAEERYGKYNPGGERYLFLQVWDVIAIADMHSGA
jgi:hypothetical protein